MQVFSYGLRFMTFICKKTIYEQVYDHFCDDIIKGTYNVDDRIPSIREFAVMLQVNPNTVVKAFELLSLKKSFINGVVLVTLFHLLHVSKL